MRRPTVAIVGLGLVGGSLARALSGAGYRVIGHDRPLVLRQAVAAGAIAVAARSVPLAVAEADIVVLAASPRTNRRLLAQVARKVRPGATLTDVGSVKRGICGDARRRGLAQFVGGHPMAGREVSGFAASTPDLFHGRRWILTPDSATTPTALRAVRALVRAAGARPVVMTPAEHDRAVAFLSHVPQVVAWALFGAARSDRVAKRHLDVAGPAFRDMTRLARSPRALWREILRENRGEVRQALAALRAALRRPV
ncbi:MAG TPA: prephenate dehydrogenase/arogenate dehydrogenase family protein [Vicinamibacteria bacterium]|nr:prephenate dehydrogenase/arogenate dehydrogenase family protein [Vicinamibacteria bacterium]